MKEFIVALAIFGAYVVVDRYIEQVETIQIKTIRHEYLNTLLDLGIEFPEVVVAQIMLETAYLSSDIYRNNNNLFGMKYNERGYATGIRKGHAAYPNKVASIKDYKEWQDMVLKLCKQNGMKVTTTEDYLYVLDHLPLCDNCRYAEDKLYTKKLRFIIKLL